MARETGLEPATSGVTGRRSNQLSYSPAAMRRLSRRTTVKSSRIQSFGDASRQRRISLALSICTWSGSPRSACRTTSGFTPIRRA